MIKSLNKSSSKWHSVTIFATKLFPGMFVFKLFQALNNSWLFNHPPPNVPPPRNKGLIAGLIKGNQWLISPCRWVFLGSYHGMIVELWRIYADLVAWEGPLGKWLNDTTAHFKGPCVHYLYPDKICICTGIGRFIYINRSPHWATSYPIYFI